jgi:hypothetical protein
MLEEFGGATAILTVMPNKVPAWVQLHLIPSLYRTETILKTLDRRIGEEIMVEMRVVPTESVDFFRVCVNLAADRPLVRFVTLTPEGRDNVMIQIKYEKMPRLCAHCVLMGHTHLECGTGEHTEDELQFGAWMVADEETWRPGTPKFRSAPFNVGTRADQNGRAPRGRGGRAGRGGRPPGGVWKRKPRSDDAKKKLVLPEGEQQPKVPPPPPVYVPPRDRKKARANPSASPSKKKAVSLEEGRQVQ